MIKDTDLINVRNRNGGATGYEIPDQNIRRSWNYGETKKIPFGELRAFSYLPGGLFALNNLLVVENKEAIDLLNMEVEPEYFYTEDDIRRLLTTGSIDEFADFLDFAPEGAIDIAKNIAVKEQIPDVRKRDMLGKKTGLNINNAIMVNEVMDAEDENPKEEEAPKRRVSLDIKKDEATAEKKERRMAPPADKYKVVSTEKK